MFLSLLLISVFQLSAFLLLPSFHTKLVLLGLLPDLHTISFFLLNEDEREEEREEEGRKRREEERWERGRKRGKKRGRSESTFERRRERESQAFLSFFISGSKEVGKS